MEKPDVLRRLFRLCSDENIGSPVGVLSVFESGVVVIVSDKGVKRAIRSSSCEVVDPVDGRAGKIITPEETFFFARELTVSAPHISGSIVSVPILIGVKS